MQMRSRREGGRAFPVLVWRSAEPLRTVATAPHGGGIGIRRWIVNAQVPWSYGRRDPDHHLGRLGVSLGLAGRGVGMLTAADVRRVRVTRDGGVEATGTATDAVCIACPAEGRLHDFGGPRSIWGSRLARAVHAAVLAGGREWGG